jgi:hypothetical protein
MKAGKLYNGESPGYWTAKYKKIGKFNDAVMAERKAFEAASKKAQPIEATYEANLKRGKWYKDYSGRLSGALLFAALAEAASQSVALGSTAVDPPEGQPPYFRTAIQALTEGDLTGANNAMVGGPTEGGLGGFVGQVGDATGDGKAALTFKAFWEYEFGRAVERAKKLEAPR